MQMAVLFVDSTGPVPIEDFSITVAESWEGGSSERDDGVLLVFAIDDRRNRLEIGYGLEPLISDTYASRMLWDARPLLRDGRYGEAAIQISRSIINRTNHLEPTGGITRVWGQQVGGILPVLFVAAMIHGYLWRRRRDFRFQTRPGFQTRQTTVRRPKRELFRPWNGGDILWWAVPVLGLVVIFWGKNIFWYPYLFFWLFCSLFMAIGTRWVHPITALVVAIYLSIPSLYLVVYDEFIPRSGPHLMDFWRYKIPVMGLWAVVGAGGATAFWLVVRFFYNSYLRIKAGKPPLPSGGRSSGGGGAVSYRSYRRSSSPTRNRRSSRSSRSSTTSSARSRGTTGSSRSSGRSSSSRSYRGGGGSFGGGGASGGW